MTDVSRFDRSPVLVYIITFYPMPLGLTECWSQLGASLRTAQAIGLHRDGTKFGLEYVT